MSGQIITNEEFTSVKEAQSGLTKLIKSAAKRGAFYRLMRNNKPLGVLIPNEVWENLVEDLEALSSPAYLERIRKARKSKKRYSAKQVKKTLGV